MAAFIDSRTIDEFPESTLAWLHRVWHSSPIAQSFPIVWVFQRFFRLHPLDWLTLNGHQLTLEIEIRKQAARHLCRLHERFLCVMLTLIVIELLRQPVLWLLESSIADHSSVPNRHLCVTLFYGVYGLTLIALALFTFDIIKFSMIPALQVSFSVLEGHQAEDLSNSPFFSMTQKLVEDPRDRFARYLRSRQSFRSEAEQSLTERAGGEQYGDPSNLFLRTQTSHSASFQRQTSTGFGKTSPNRSSWNDNSMNRSFNRSFGSNHSSRSSTTSSPSILLAAQDWDPLDRQQVDSICGQDALAKLLAQEEQFEKQKVSINDDERMNWSPQIQTLRDQNYQTSAMFRIPSPKKQLDESARTQTDPPPTIMPEEKTYPLEDYSWMQLKVSPEVLHFWTENVRLWMADTVVAPLLVRIDQVNLKLRERLRMDNVVGETAPDQLRLIAQQCRGDMPELLQVIPFLDISMQQDYVVKRLRELARDGVLGDYCWNSGAPYGGQQWQDFLPTDAALVMHCFITFLDVLLPPDPHAPNWRSFSHRHVLRSLSMWKSEEPQKPMIHQAVSNPPKYEVLLNGQFLQVSEGKNNVFHTILLFTRLLYLREKAGRGYANLGAGRVIFKLFDSYSQF